MSCDQRPASEACNCCGDAELNNKISELQARITELNTKIQELSTKEVPLPKYTDCNGITLPNNASVATCADLNRALGGGGGSTGVVDCNGRPVTTVPSCEQFNSLASRTDSNTRAIDTLTNIIDKIPRTPPSGGGGIGNSIDRAILDGLQAQITQLGNVVNEFRSSTSQRLLDLEACCNEYRNGQGQGGGSDGACDYNGWKVAVHRAHLNQTMTLTTTVTGPANKSGTIIFSPSYFDQRSFTLDSNGTFTHAVTLHQVDDVMAHRDIHARVVHCGREVATTIG